MKLKFLKKISLAFCAVICLVALGLALLLPTTAQAYKDGASPSSIGSIFNENATTGGSFDRTNMEKLLTQLGASGSNLEAMVTNLQSQVSGNKSSAKSGDKEYVDTKQVANKGIIVEFGGIKWLAVFLSLTNDGSSDVVLTLWQAEVTNSSENKSSWSYVNGNYGTSAENKDVTYPANMYGTSYIRAVTLNNGGTYATSISTTANATQDPNNKYAKFTMEDYSGGKSNISQFLVKPSSLAWQQNLQIPASWNWTQKGKSQNNEAWGKFGAGQYYNNICYEGKTGFDAWKDDLIWIPACSEVGNFYSGQTNNGIWGTTQDQNRVANAESTEAVWLRTAHKV